MTLTEREADLSFRVDGQKSFWLSGEFQCLPNIAGFEEEKILSRDQVYGDLTTNLDLPDLESLLGCSSLLKAFPDLKQKSFAEEVAFDEYVHFLAQTYYFEVFGFQLLASLSVSAPRFEFAHSLAFHSHDEIKHCFAYLKALKNLNVEIPEPSEGIARLFDRLILNSSFVEKLVSGSLVLESIAIGLVQARSEFLRGESISTLDEAIVKDEIHHLVEISDMFKTCLYDLPISKADLHDLVREGVQNIGEGMLPLSLLQKFGIEESEENLLALKSSGIVRKQREISMKHLTATTKVLRRNIDRSKGRRV